MLKILIEYTHQCNDYSFLVPEFLLVLCWLEVLLLSFGMRNVVKDSIFVIHHYILKSTVAVGIFMLIKTNFIYYMRWIKLPSKPLHFVGTKHTIFLLYVLGAYFPCFFISDMLPDSKSLLKCAGAWLSEVV